MDIPELANWLRVKIADEERNLAMVKDSNRKMPVPDIVARRVVETQLMDYRNILRRISE